MNDEERRFVSYRDCSFLVLFGGKYTKNLGKRLHFFRKKRDEPRKGAHLGLCRGDPTRTGDRLVPNQERYQLRYTPENGCKGTPFLANHQITARFFSFFPRIGVRYTAHRTLTQSPIFPPSSTISFYTRCLTRIYTCAYSYICMRTCVYTRKR